MLSALSPLDVQTPLAATFIFKIVVVLCSAFMAVTFSQSALDKIMDYRGNKAYFDTQFEKSILKNFVGVLLPVLTLLEAATGLLCVFGNVWRLFTHDSSYIFFGLVVAAVTLLSLLLGQRIAKDYAGAASLAGYFIIAVIGLLAEAASL